MKTYSGKTRVESDLIGAMEVPVEALYGVQTLRGVENFPISRFHLYDYPAFVNALIARTLKPIVSIGTSSLFKHFGHSSANPLTSQTAYQICIANAMHIFA